MSRQQTAPAPDTAEPAEQAPPTAPAGPRVTRRENSVELPAPYTGFVITVWSNYPGRLTGELESGDMARIRAAMAHIVIAHNGWLDFDGNPYPPASEEAFWEAIPPELLAVVMMTATQEASRLPNSLAARRTR